MNDDRLILYYYDDGLPADERQAISAALERDAAMADRYRALSKELDAMQDPPDVSPPEGLEYRLRSSLDRAARLEQDRDRRRPWPGVPRLFAWGAALAAAVAVGLGLGLWLGESPAPVSPGLVQGTPPDPVEWSTAAFHRGLESHFRSGRSELDHLQGNGELDRAALVDSLLQQNRLYAQLAQHNDAPDLARVLRSFEPLLRELGRDDLSPEQSAQLQAQLQFEFTVMLTKLSRGSSQQTETNMQEISL